MVMKKTLRHMCVAMLILLAMAMNMATAVMCDKAKGETSLTEMAKEVLALKGIDAESVKPEDLSFVESRIVDVSNIMEQYLDRKYPGVVFHPEFLVPRDYDQLYDRFLLRSNADDEEVVVEALETEGGLEFTDDYYGKRISTDYRRWLEERFADLDGSLQVVSSVDCMLGQKFGFDYPLEKAVSDSDFYAYVYFLVLPSDVPFETLVNGFTRRLERLGLSGFFTLCRLLEPLPEAIGWDEALDIIASNSDHNPVFSDRRNLALVEVDRGDEK